jgi:hypothetical protein
MKYQFHVVAQNSRGISIPSEILQVTTLIEVYHKFYLVISIYNLYYFIIILFYDLQANVPGPPMNLEGHATSSLSISLSWEEPHIINGRISKYIITFMEVCDFIIDADSIVLDINNI